MLCYGKKCPVSFPAITSPGPYMASTNGCSLSALIWLNTTSPVNQQLRALDNFTDDELAAVISYDDSVTMTCPTEFKLIIHHITRLRQSFASTDTDSIVQDAATTTLASKLNRTHSFDVEKWAAARYAQKTSMVIPLSNIFAVAIRLYAILSLPENAIAAWLRTAPQISLSYPKIDGLSVHESLRIGHRDELLHRIHDIWDSLIGKLDVAWPLIVAGVASTDTPAREQDFITDALMEIWMLPASAASFILAKEKLQAFWRSGGSGWEDCFDEPTASIC